jgi:hypothetical protein
MTDKKNMTVIIVAAIAAIAAVEIYALSKGIDGVLLAGGFAAIGALAGWAAPQPNILKK